MSMSANIYPIKLNKDYYVVTANDLIKGRQKMSLREAQILYIAMSQVVKDDKDFKTYNIPVSSLADFMNINTSSLYRDLEHICTDLLKRVVKIQLKDSHNPQEKKWKAFQWISYAAYENGRLTIKLNDELKPFLIDLVSHYSQILLGTLCSFKSYYSARLYQLIVCEQGENPYNSKEEWEFSCEYIREFFQLDKTEYPRAYDLINKILKPALTELRESDFCTIWDFENIYDSGRGKPIIGAKFKALSFKDKAEKDRFDKHWNLPFIKEKETKPRSTKTKKKQPDNDEDQIRL